MVSQDTKHHATQYLYLAHQVRELDRLAIEQHGIPGIQLMKRAGQACVKILTAAGQKPRSVTVLCGKGNNGGDGYIVAGLLANRGVKVSVVQCGTDPAKGTDAWQAREFCLASSAQVELAQGDPDAMLARLAPAVIVDALLGTGLNSQVGDDLARVIQAANRYAKDQSGVILSVDIPSGLCADTGAVLGQAIKANSTVTFIARKLGCYTNNGPEHCGQLHFDSLGVPEAVYADFHSVGSQLISEMPQANQDLQSTVNTQVVSLLDYECEVSCLPTRHRNAHKGDHGHLLVVGGNEGMGGAALMAAEAALMAAAGKVTVATRASNVPAIQARRPELMTRVVNNPEDLISIMGEASALVLGPGLGRDDWAGQLLPATLSAGLPILVDADALHILGARRQAGVAGLDSLHQAVLTPHPGEAYALLDGLEKGAAKSSDAKIDIQDNRLAVVHELRQRYGATILLKGSGTLIAWQDNSNGTSQLGSQGTEVCLCPYGNPGMSVAGMGDVLSGVIGALLCQGLMPAAAARLGAVVHAKAADNLVAQQGELGLLATELLPEIRRLLNPAGQGGI